MRTSRRWPRSEGQAQGGARLVELEKIDAVEMARAQGGVLIDVVGAAAVFVAALHVHGAAPILRRFRRLERAVLPLRFPVLAIRLLDGAVEVLDIYRALVVI